MNLEGSNKEIFVMESKELIAKMETALLSIEQGAPQEELLHSIFRSSHTLKSAAAMFNCVDLSSLAHEIESILSLCKANKQALSKNKIEVLLLSIDCLKNLLQESIRGNISPELQARRVELIKNLKNDNNDIRSYKDASVNKNNIANIKDTNQFNNNTSESNNFIKVKATKLDEIINFTGELCILQSYLNDLIKDNGFLNKELDDVLEKFSKLAVDLKSISLQLRMLPIKETFSKFNRLVRDLAVQENKEIKLEIIGGEIELDKFILEKINEPLLHLIRNSCVHGVDFPSNRLAIGKAGCGIITLSATQNNNEVILMVADDGCGINLNKVTAKAIKTGLIDKKMQLSEQAIINLIFTPGFSTAEQITELSGRGFGMDIVKKEIEKLHGTIEVISKLEEGTKIIIRLPLTLAILDGLLFKLKDFFFIIPTWNIIECINITSDEYQSILENNYFNFRNKVISGLILSDLLGITNQQNPLLYTTIIIQYIDRQVAIVIGLIPSKIQTIIKPMPEIFHDIPWNGGTTILGSGDVAIILDPVKLINYVIATNKCNLNKVSYSG